MVSLPTRTRFRGIYVREALIFEGSARWSEFSPFPEYRDEEASAWLQAAIEFGFAPGDTLPQPRVDRVPVNATLPAIAPDEIQSVLDRFHGCTTVKVKVAERGQSLSDDIARVRRTRELMGDSALIRIDANAGWSLGEAIEAIGALAPFGLDYAEQPCASVEDLASLRERISDVRNGDSGGRVLIAADESVRKADDPIAVARAGAADLLVVKAQPLGGILRAHEIIREAGLPVVVSSALDTSVGISMGVHLASSLPEGLLYGACGLATVELLAADVTENSLVPHNGSIEVRPVDVSLDLLDRYRATHEREIWWLERLTRCYEILSANGQNGARDE